MSDSSLEKFPCANKSCACATLNDIILKKTKQRIREKMMPAKEVSVVRLLPKIEVYSLAEKSV